MDGRAAGMNEGKRQGKTSSISRTAPSMAGPSAAHLGRIAVLTDSAKTKLTTQRRSGISCCLENAQPGRIGLEGCTRGKRIFKIWGFGHAARLRGADLH
jgi:hypothetical protein